MTSLPIGVWLFLGHFLRRQPIKFLVVFIGGLSWALNEVTIPYFVKLIIDIIHTHSSNQNEIYDVLLWPVSALLVTCAGSYLFSRIQGLVMISAFPIFRAQIREAVVEYVKLHSHEYFSNQLSGSIGQKIASLPISCQSVVEIVFFSLSPLFLGFAITLAFMWQVSPFFFAILLSWLSLHLGSTFIALNSGDKRWKRHSNAVSVLNGQIIDMLTNIRNVRLFSRYSYESEYINKFQIDEIKKAKSALFVVESIYLFQTVIGLAFIVIVVLTLLSGWMNGWVTVGDFSMVITLAFWIIGMVWYLSFQFSIIIRELSTIKEALRLITARHDVVDMANAKPLVIKSGDIKFVDVNFTYPNKKSIFEHLNMHIFAGEKVGLVGFSGSGKSTFVNLILRLYDVTTGDIYVDNQNIATVTQNSLREQIAMIPQDPILFHRTLMENIRYGRLDATNEEVIAAAKAANCHEFILALIDGYETIVGEHGIKLSGGQRQRIAIARAILKNAPILILDEATSSLDSVVERQIQESLHSLMEGKTSIVIAHRLSTLADMDRILVFNNGRIVEDGSREFLLKKNGYFAKLWRLQVSGFLPERETA